MLHNDIFKEYLKIFGFKPDNVVDWFPNGLNSIRIVYKNGYTLIFTYNNGLDWKLETEDSFLETLFGKIAAKIAHPFMEDN